MKQKHPISRFISALFFSGIIISAPLASNAEEGASPGGNWDFSLAPLYVWGINIEGDTSLQEPADEIKLDNKEIFDNLEGAFSLNFSGVHRESRFGFLFDILYLNV